MYFHKTNFFKRIIEFIQNIISLEEFNNKYQEFLKDISVNQEEIDYFISKKNIERGNFLKGTFLEYVLIPKEENFILNKYFKSTNNIYNGTFLIKDNIYYKFFTFKLIRDNLQNENFLTTENEQFENLIKINNKKTIIGKIQYLTNKNEYNKALKCKLVEEANELLNSKTRNHLLEEIADVYTIIIIINKISKEETTKY
jgi:hypothetical protein